jgi:hypothetical protein
VKKVNLEAIAWCNDKVLGLGLQLQGFLFSSEFSILQSEFNGDFPAIQP